MPSTAIGGDGIYPGGLYAGLQAHGMLCVNSSEWGLWQRSQAISLRVNATKAITVVKKASKRVQLMSLHFDMYQDGQVTPKTLAMFRELTAAIYAMPE